MDYSDNWKNSMSTFKLREHITTIDSSGNIKSETVQTTSGEFYDHMLEQHLNQEALAIEFEKNQYKQDRLLEYPPLADLADALYWQANGDNSKMEEYLSRVESVKNKYPKGQA
jgi:hypothetical protein